MSYANAASSFLLRRSLSLAAAWSGIIQETLATLDRHVSQTGEILTEAQVTALEKKQDDNIAHGEIETAHTGYLGSQDTFYVGTIKGVGRIYQQTFVDTYSKWATAKLYDQNKSFLFQ